MKEGEREGKREEREKREGKREGDRLRKAKAESTPLAHAVARYLSMSNLHALASRAAQRESTGDREGGDGDGDGGGDSSGDGKGGGKGKDEGGDEHGLGDNSEVKILNLLLAAGADRLAAVNQPVLGSPRVSDEKCFALLRHVLRPLYVRSPHTLNLLRSKLGEAGADRLIRYKVSEGPNKLRSLVGIFPDER